MGNADRAGARFGEAQRAQVSGAQWTVPYGGPAQSAPGFIRNAWASGAQEAVSSSQWASGEQPVSGFDAYEDDPVDESPRNPGIPQNPNRRRRRTLAWLIPVLAVVLIVGGVFAYRGLANKAENDRIAAEQKAREEALRAKVAPYDAAFCPNVFVDGVDLGGLTADEARAAVHASNDSKRWSISLVGQDGSPVLGPDAQPIVITEATVGVEFDIETALEAAWHPGHDGDDQTRAQAMDELALTPYRGETSASQVDLSVIEPTLNHLAQEWYVAPQDAYFDENTGFDPRRLSDPFIIQHEVVGQVLDTDGLRAQIARLAHDGQSGSVTLTTRPLQPEVTEAALRTERFALIGEATTPISTRSTEDRNNNIRRAYELISGTVIQPGRQFSFNGIVGQRTLANGFFPAEEYVYGEHVEGIGGGVCQASSTIYVAAVRANMRIVSRRPHSLAVNYTPYGMDATVYWYDKDHKIDFSFANDSASPIYITATVEQNPERRSRLQCHVRIYGHTLGDGISYDLVTEETVLPAPEEPEVRRDKNARYVRYTDETYELQEAADGVSVQSWRVRYFNGVELADSREPLYTDVYDAKQQIIYVGTRERPEER